MDFTRAEAWDWGKDSIISCVVNKTLWLGLILTRKRGFDIVIPPVMPRKLRFTIWMIGTYEMN